MEFPAGEGMGRGRSMLGVPVDEPLNIYRGCSREGLNGVRVAYCSGAAIASCYPVIVDLKIHEVHAS